MSADRRVLEAFARLEHDADFKVVMEWITMRRDEHRANDNLKDETVLRWRQGQAQEATTIIDTAKSARQTLNK